MVRGWRFDDGGAGVPIDPLLDTTDFSPRPESLVWIDCEDPSAEQVTYLGRRLGIHALSVEDLLHRGQRTKLHRYPDHSHVVVRDCTLRGWDLQAVEVDLVFGPGWVMSVRQAGEAGEVPAALEEVRDRFDQHRFDSGVTDEGFVIWAILDAIVDRWFTAIEGIDERLDVIEDRVFSDDAPSMPQEAFALRRSLLTFRRAAAPLREVIASFLRREIPEFSDESLVHFQDVHDHALRVVDLIESQRELLTDLRDAQLSMASNRMNRVMKATSSWGAILVLNTLIAGIYGMNFRHMPELDWYLGYPMSLGLMALVTFAGYRVFKARDWL